MYCINNCNVLIIAYILRVLNFSYLYSECYGRGISERKEVKDITRFSILTFILNLYAAVIKLVLHKYGVLTNSFMNPIDTRMLFRIYVVRINQKLKVVSTTSLNYKPVITM